MDNNERTAQTAVGLTKSYRVSMTFPVESTGHFQLEIQAVSDEDARAQAMKVCQTLTKKYIERIARIGVTKISIPVEDFNVSRVTDISPRSPGKGPFESDGDESMASTVSAVGK